MRPLKYIKIFKAFTLAEVLITLGIIGVVAALTIPTLVKNYQKTQTVTQLKKAYTTLAQAVKQSEIANGNCADWDWGTDGDAASIRQSFDTLWAPYLRISNFCTTLGECGYSNGINNLAGAGANGVVSPTTRTTLVLSDGTVLIIWVSIKAIVVDINAGKRPNIYGKDVFYFILDASKGLMPTGYNLSTNTVNNDCSTSGTGYYCASKIMRDGWEMKSDYPW